MFQHKWERAGAGAKGGGKEEKWGGGAAEIRRTVAQGKASVAENHGGKIGQGA